MELKILNLNIWNYNKWNERRPRIVKFIKKHNPEIVVLQEVRDDIRFNKKGYHQAKQLNEKLKYPFIIFSKSTDKKKEWPERYNKYCVEGTAIMSKYPIFGVKNKTLKKHKRDRYGCTNLYFKIKAEKIIDFVAVHFSPNELFSSLHLKETLDYIKQKKIKPIIIGDFNIVKPKHLNVKIAGKYKSSLQYKKYISYPPNNFTLDYIVIPNEFKFKSLKCLGRGLSDHKALVAKVVI